MNFLSASHYSVIEPKLPHTYSQRAWIVYASNYRIKRQRTSSTWARSAKRDTSLINLSCVEFVESAGVIGIMCVGDIFLVVC